MTDTHITSAMLSLPHGFMMRRGGVSQGIYDSLNCGFRHNREGKAYDPKENVIENRRRAVSMIGGQPNNLCLVTQVHGVVCVNIDKPQQGEIEADAMVTSQPNLVLGIQTADCVPVLFHEPVNQIIGAAHAGWRGALDGVIESTIKGIEALGGQKRHIKAAIGPAIDQDSYEVGQELFDAFAKKEAPHTAHFAKGKEIDKYLFDLPAYVKFRLEACGVKDLDQSTYSTYTNEAMFFSCRRAFHRNEPSFGNQLSLIFMKTV